MGSAQLQIASNKRYHTKVFVNSNSNLLITNCKNVNSNI